MTELSDADMIWNRAAMGSGGPSPAPGDIALSAVLRFHGLAMSGGVLNTPERLSHIQVGEAVQGFRWFGLDDAATFLESAIEQLQSSDQSPEAEEAIEAQFDSGYSIPISKDQTIASAFRERYSTDPLSFAPVR
jgi:hypothetical protein